ncbi:MAG: glycosyltransferase family 2 protein [Desulfatibacillum sp.]|nr:glycosyltransferase family 2 protein [Desulfatibacillum sp.]
MTSTQPGLTVFCPVYNEEEIIVANIQRLLAFLDSLNLGLPFEIIIGSNGSDDRTVELAQSLAREHAPLLKVFHLPEKGVGKAFVKGVEEARFDRIVTVDMDLSIDMEFIPRAFKLLDDFQIVIGSKVTGDQKRPWIRKSVSNLFIQLARVLLNIGFHDYSIAAKAYRTDMVKKYLPYADDLTFYVVKIVYFAARDGHRITEVPVSCHDMRESRFNLVHEGFYKFGNLFLLWARKK